MLSSQNYSATTTQSNYAYGSGVQLQGVVGMARVSIGGIETSQDIPIDVVTQVTCLPSKPQCPASKLSAQDYRIGGNGVAGQGFYAIIGIGMRHADAANPLISLGNSAWIVELPTPGDSTPGKIIVNPTPDESASYRVFQLMRNPTNNGWLDNKIPSCLLNSSTGKKFCLDTLIDSGAWNFEMTSTSFGTTSFSVPSGSNMTLSLAPSTGEMVSTSFVVASLPGK